MIHSGKYVFLVGCYVVKFKECNAYEMMQSAIDGMYQHVHEAKNECTELNIGKIGDDEIFHNTIIIRSYNKHMNTIPFSTDCTNILTKVFGVVRLSYEINLYYNKIHIHIRTPADKQFQTSDIIYNIGEEHYDLTEEMWFQMSLVQNVEDIDYSYMKSLCNLCSLLSRG